MPARPVTLAPGAVPTHVRVTVYEPDGATLIAELDERTGLAWQETAVGAPGQGAVTVHQDAEVLAAHPGILRKRNVVKLRYDEDLDAFFAFRIKASTYVVVDEAEDAGRLVTVSGPDITSWFDWGIVKPEGGVRAESPTDRAFGWMSAVGGWYDPDMWLAAQGVVVHDASLGAKVNSPHGWPDDLAEWIAPNDPTTTFPVGNAYFRKTFTLDDETEIVFSASFDNAGIVFIDNMSLFGADYTRTWAQTYAVSLVLPAGEHTVGAQVYNDTGLLTLTGNPVGLLFSACELNSDGSRGDVLFRSDDSWLAYDGDGTEPPAVLGAEILRTLILEAQARDVAGIKELAFGFTPTLDSASVAWTSAASVGVVNTKVGDTVLTVKDQLCSLAGFDVWMDYENLVVHAAPDRGLDLSASVTFGRRVNLMRWQVDEEDEIRNAPLVRFDGGWIDMTEPTSIGEWGRTETLLDIGSAQSAERAQMIAEAAYGLLANPQTYGQAGDQRVRPGKKPEGALIAVEGAVPWSDFFPGDYVSGFDAEGIPVRAWIVSMSGSEDEDGNLTFDPELQDASGDFTKRPPLKGQPVILPAYQVPADYVYGGGYNTDAAPTSFDAGGGSTIRGAGAPAFASAARRPGAPGSYNYVTPETAEESGGGSGLAIVDATEPTSPPTGQLWFDEDDTC